MAEDPIRRGREPGPGVERVRVRRGEERARGLRRPQAAPHEHLRQHVRAAELVGQPRGGREVVRGDLQARVHDPPEARRAGGRNRDHEASSGAVREDCWMAPADFPAGFFERVETGDHADVRLDDAGIAAVRDLYSDLSIDGRVLDLCRSSARHFDVPPDELVEFGGDPDDALPYDDAAFDDVLCAGGVGTLTRPLDAFAEVARVLRPGGRLVCTFAGAHHARAAIRGWVSTDDAGRVRIVRAYFARTPAFGAGRERPAHLTLRRGRPALGVSCG